MSTFHWNLWLEQSSQIWKDLFLLNLRNSTIPKVFLSEIVNFPSFHIQTFHISCGSPPQLPPVHYLTLYSHLTRLPVKPPKWSSKWKISCSAFLVEKYKTKLLFCESFFHKLFFLFHFVPESNIFTWFYEEWISSLKEKGRNLWTEKTKLKLPPVTVMIIICHKQKINLASSHFCHLNLNWPILAIW